MDKWTTTDALTDITSAADDASFYVVDTDIESKMATIVGRVTTIKKSVSDVLGRIRTILVNFCNIPEKVRAESAIATIVIKLPNQLNGKPDPLVAEEFKSTVLKIIATYPEQLWAVVPALTRTLADSQLTQPWEAPKLRCHPGIHDPLLCSTQQATLRDLGEHWTGIRAALSRIFLDWRRRYAPQAHIAGRQE